MKIVQETMSTLWRHAGEHLTADELDSLSSVTEDAAMLAQHLATTCDRLAAVASEDDGEGGSWISDAHSQAALLWNIAAQADAIGALVTVGTQAKERLNELARWTVDAQLAARKKMEAVQEDGTDANAQGPHGGLLLFACSGRSGESHRQPSTEVGTTMQDETTRAVLSQENQLAMLFALSGDDSDHPPDRVAAYLGRSVGTLSNWRNIGCGPKFRRVGGNILYRKCDVIGWIEANPAVSSLTELSELKRQAGRKSR